jgi:pyruvate-formate lyase-activating enzyme
VTRSGFLPDRIIHLHPTGICNLACLHCYSESNPQQRTALDTADLYPALEVLRSEGYTQVSLSGGEPLVYKSLAGVVEHARTLGYRVTMISNGLLATERMDPLLEQLDGMAISFDGLEEAHNTMRGRPDAFSRACAALERLAAKGWPVAAAISVTRDSIPDLPDLAEHLVRLGARALQIRPVARAGRARTLGEQTFYSPTDRARLYLVASALQQELGEHVRVHCDLAPTLGLWRQRDDYTGLLGSCDVVCLEDRPLADLVNPLVITDTGVVKPIAYDFHKRFDIASVNDLSSDGLHDYKRQRLPEFRELMGGAVAALRDARDLVDWFDHCARLSESTATT